jgi:hypothetical protein
MKRIVRALVVFVVASAVAVPSVGASQPRCTSDDAKALFEHGMRGFDLLAQGITDKPIVDLVQRCQYRLFLEGEHTFRATDVILGGAFYFYTKAELDELGWTRQQGIDDLKLIETRLFLAKKLPDGSLGTPVEQTLRRLPFTNYSHSQLGPLVYTQVAFTAHLKPGDYVSIYQDKFPTDSDFFEVRVDLHIVPG